MGFSYGASVGNNRIWQPVPHDIGGCCAAERLSAAHKFFQTVQSLASTEIPALRTTSEPIMADAAATTGAGSVSLPEPKVCVPRECTATARPSCWNNRLKLTVLSLAPRRSRPRRPAGTVEELQEIH